MKTVRISGRGLTGTLKAPSSKSLGHRSLICAALSSEVSTLHRVQSSEDIEATIEAVRRLGAEVIRSGETLHVKGAAPGAQPAIPRCFPCGESGSTLRFMMPVGMLWSGEKTYEGKGRLPERPIGEYLRNFDALGIQYDYRGKLPFKTLDRLKPGLYKLSGGESSQYLSGLMMALPLLEADSVIEVEGVLESEDYVALTVAALEKSGIKVGRTDSGGYMISGNQTYKGTCSTIEGDYSQAAFFIVAGLIGASGLRIDQLDPCSKQADRRIVEIVQRMGGQLAVGADFVQVQPSQTFGTVIEASQCPDIVPILAVLAALSSGETRIQGGSRLRIKESDRIKSTVALIQALGGKVLETADGMVIAGSSRLSGGRVDSFGDHRIVMAASVAALRCDGPVWIDGAEAVNKSYPKFFEDFSALGGEVSA